MPPDAAQRIAVPSSRRLLEIGQDNTGLLFLIAAVEGNTNALGMLDSGRRGFLSPG
jgi:hypothetical protein